MTKLVDQFAASALPTCINICASKAFDSREDRVEYVAQLAYEFANAMMVARDECGIHDDDELEVSGNVPVTVEEAFGFKD